MATCKSCSQPLVLELDLDDFNEATSSAAGGSQSVVPDDLQLSCGCHFHWLHLVPELECPSVIEVMQPSPTDPSFLRPDHRLEKSRMTDMNRQCLLDESSQLAAFLTCPSCQNLLVSAPAGPPTTNIIYLLGHLQIPQILICYTNEGGIQDNLDIQLFITEEAYLDANPTARPARAIMTMCSQGDVGGIIELLQTVQDYSGEKQDSMSPTNLICYQDPLYGMKSALHLAIEKGQQDVVLFNLNPNLLLRARQATVHVTTRRFAHPRPADLSRRVVGA